MSMKLVDLTLEIRFKGGVNLVQNDLRLDLAKKLAPPSSQPKQADDEGIQVHNKEKRIAIGANKARYAITLQEKNIKTARSKLETYVRTINDTIDYSNLDVARVGIRTIWVHKYGNDIKELQRKYKDSFYANNDIIESAFDFAIVLTLKTDDFTIGYQSGPVEKNEPLQNVAFPVNDLKEANIYTSVDCYVLDYEKMDIDQIMQLANLAIDIGKEKTKNTLAILGVSQ